MDDETLVTRPAVPPAEPTTSDAELSRIAREAVRQPADPRMDRQLARMGLTDDPEDAARPSTPAAASALAIATERTDRLEGRVRRLEFAVVVLVVAVVVLTAVLVVRTTT